jgi:D-glycero-D-manno-heptose 1,7-bisphosphate phosphatase
MVVSSNKAIFLDRDGVIVKGLIKNKKSYAPKSLKDFKILPKVSFFSEKLKKKKFKLIIVTNQPDISRGLINKSTLNHMHKLLKEKCKFDDIYVSISSSNKSFYRKPNPGMLISAIKKHNLNINKCYLIGDRASDIAAAQKVGCKSIFIERNYAEKKPTAQIKTVKSFAEASKYIIKEA